jgi:hypothetical protein
LQQGVYFFVTDIWPIISIDTFQRVTGPKTELCLVKTVGIILTSRLSDLSAGYCGRRYHYLWWLMAGVLWEFPWQEIFSDERAKL